MSRRAWVLFALVVVLWGIPYFLIKIALRDVSPAMLVWTRVTIGAVTLLPIAIMTGALKKLRDRIAITLFLGVLEVTAPFVLITAGEGYISSSLTGILIATEPTLVLLFAFWLDATERPDRSRLLGLAVGIIGVALLLGLSVTGSNVVIGGLMVLGATACYAAGALLIKKRFADVPPIASVTAALLVTSVVLAVPAALTAPRTFPSADAVGALLVLGVACTGAGFLCFFALIKLAGAARATLITYAAPLIAVALGVFGRGESFTVATAAGLILILAGSWVAGRSSDGGVPNGAIDSSQTAEEHRTHAGGLRQ
ncbi:MAG: DMT family transporter [Chloroflexota bacterium]